MISYQTFYIDIYMVLPKNHSCIPKTDVKGHLKINCSGQIVIQIGTGCVRNRCGYFYLAYNIQPTNSCIAHDNIKSVQIYMYILRNTIQDNMWYTVY